MYTEFVIFVVISAFLVAAIYSSSVSVVFAFKGGCSFTPGGDVICVTKDKKVYYCTKVKTTYRCDLQVAKTGIPPALSDALDAAIQDTQNNTKFSKDTNNFNELIGNGTSTDGNGDTKIPKDLGSLNEGDLH